VSSARLPCTATCDDCGNRSKVEVHPSDQGGSIRYVCDECEAITEHRTGEVRLA